MLRYGPETLEWRFSSVPNNNNWSSSRLRRSTETRDLRKSPASRSDVRRRGHQIIIIFVCLFFVPEFGCTSVETTCDRYRSVFAIIIIIIIINYSDFKTTRRRVPRSNVAACTTRRHDFYSTGAYVARDPLPGGTRTNDPKTGGGGRLLWIFFFFNCLPISHASISGVGESKTVRNNVYRGLRIPFSLGSLFFFFWSPS